jgi:hypothetical protein
MAVASPTPRKGDADFTPDAVVEDEAGGLCQLGAQGTDYCEAASRFGSFQPARGK